MHNRVFTTDDRICSHQHTSAGTPVNNCWINLAVLLHNSCLAFLWFCTNTLLQNPHHVYVPKQLAGAAVPATIRCLLVLQGLNDKHRGDPAFIMRAQMCFSQPVCDLWDNWAGLSVCVLKNGLCGGDNQDG